MAKKTKSTKKKWARKLTCRFNEKQNQVLEEVMKAMGHDPQGIYATKTVMSALSEYMELRKSNDDLTERNTKLYNELGEINNQVYEFMQMGREMDAMKVSWNKLKERRLSDNESMYP